MEKRRYLTRVAMGLIMLGLGTSTLHGSDSERLTLHRSRSQATDTDMEKKPENEPVFIEGSGCRDGDCQKRGTECNEAGCKTGTEKKNGKEGCMHRFCRWLFYRPLPLPCECHGSVPGAIPPQSAWFPCRPGSGTMGNCALYPNMSLPAPMPATPQYQTPPGQPPVPPPTPRYTYELNPMFPQSMAAMAQFQQILPGDNAFQKKVPPATRPALPNSNLPYSARTDNAPTNKSRWADSPYSPIPQK